MFIIHFGAESFGTVRQHIVHVTEHDEACLQLYERNVGFLFMKIVWGIAEGTVFIGVPQKNNRALTNPAGVM
jgi:hypothetical protein